VLFDQAGSVIVEDTTYLRTLFKCAELPDASSVCSGQYPRKSSKVFRPNNNASSLAICSPITANRSSASP
jgi:hypothetical protein